MSYLDFLCTRWRLATGVYAIAALTIIGEYAGDPTWNITTSLLMGAMTYATAPYSIGVAIRTWKFPEKVGAVDVLLAAWSFVMSVDVAYMVSNGWAVDPDTRIANILASGLLYILAGLFWSFKKVLHTGQILFVFSHPAWFEVRAATDRLSPLDVTALAIVGLPAAAMLLYFVV